MKKLISLAVAAASFSSGALAQEALVLEEVIVTAQKRASTLRDVAATVNVITGNDVTRFRTFNFAEIEEQTAGLTLATPNARNPNISLRGISVDPESGISSAVDVYWNDSIMRADTVFSQLYDIERFEILRGPQGTLQGRTSPAGAINVITRGPNLDAFEANVQGSVSDNEGLNGQAAVNIPIVEGKLGVRIAGVYDENFANNVESLTSGLDDPEQETTSGRLSVGWAPTDEFEATLVWQNFDRDTDDVKALDGVDNLGERPSLSSDDRRGLGATDDFTDFEYDIATLTLDWEVAGHLVTSVTGYVDSDKSSRQENDRGNYEQTDGAPTFQTSDTEVETTTQEIRIASQDRDFWNYMVGFFYQDQETTTEFRANTVLTPPSPVIGFQTGGQIPVDTEIMGIFTFNSFDLTDDVVLELGVRYSDFEAERSADVEFFGLNYLPPPLQALEDATGLVSAGFAAGFPIIAVSPENQKSDEDAVTGSLSLRYNLTPDISVYGSYSRGYRPGGISIVPDPDVQFLPNGEDDLLHDEEDSDAIELGFKGRFLDGRASLNGAIYYRKFDGYLGFVRGVQVLNDTGDPVDISGGLIFNGDADAYGLELEGRILLTENWSAGGALSALKAEWDGAEAPCNEREPGEILGFCDIDGENISGEPEFSLSLNSEYVIPMGGNELYLRGLYKFTGERDNQDASAGVGAVVDEFEETNILNLYAGLRSNDGKWDVGVWAKNVFDEDEVVFQTSSDQYDLAFSGGSYTQTNVQQERVVGATINYNW